MFGVQEEKLRINGSLTLSCLTKGFPEPKVHWFKDGQVGVLSSRAPLEYQTHSSKVILMEQVQPLLATSTNCSRLKRLDILFSKPPTLSRLYAVHNWVNYRTE